MIGTRLRVTPRKALVVSVVVVAYGGLLAVSLQSSFGGTRHADAIGTLSAGISGAGSGSEALGKPAASADAPAAGGDATPAVHTPGVATGAGGGSGASTGREQRGAAVAGAGARAGEVLIGVEIDHDNTAAYNALGVKGAATGDQAAMVQAVVKWINGQGGMAGRTVVPLIHESQVETSTFAAQAQAACSDFTEDHHVFAVVGRTSDRDDLYRCLATKGVPFVAQHRYLWHRQSLQAGAGLLYQPGGLGGGRWDTWVRSLATTGYFAPTGNFGVLRFDTPAYERTYKETVEPAIRREGVQVAQEVVIHQPEAVSNFGSTGAELGNAIIRLKAANVDHLMILDEGTLAFLFMPEAESQDYHPRYGLHSQNIPQVLSVNVPAAQLHASVGAGWVPTLDVDFAQDPGGMPGLTLCQAIYNKAGVELKERVTESFAMRYCDSLRFLKAALDRAPSFDRAGLRAGVEALGHDHQSSLTLSAVFGPGRHDGADEVRPFAFDDACACFAYR